MCDFVDSDVVNGACYVQQMETKDTFTVANYVLFANVTNDEGFYVM